MLAWGDPFTSLYTWHEQGKLSRELGRPARWQRSNQSPGSPVLTSTQMKRTRAAILAARSRRFAAELRDGTPIGRIVVPKLHLAMVVVQGTSEGDLEKGPGHYDVASGENSSLPGAGGVVAIAGHRTTYLHPFRHIDALESGDTVYLEMPYGTFRYRVYFHKIVVPTDWTILRPRTFEKLVLTACHPLYSASHRWVTFARLEGESPNAAG